MKNCSKGKGCGATCIDGQERCSLELGPKVSSATTKVRDFLLRATQIRERDTDWSAKDAGKWLKANLKNIDGYHLDHLEGGPKAMWVIGNEPGSNVSMLQLENPSFYRALKAKYPGVSDEELSKSAKKIVMEQPELVARLLRDDMERSRLVSRTVGKRVNAETYRNNAQMAKLLESDNVSLMMNIKDVRENPDNYPPDLNGKSYFRGKAMAVAEQIGGAKVGFSNMSMLSSPDENIWPWGKVFEKAGMDPGVFKSRGSWLKHTSEARGEKLIQQIKDKKPGQVLLTGGNSEKMFLAMAREHGGAKTVELRWQSKNGAEKVSRFAVMKIGGTNVVWGPHMTAQVPQAVLDMRAKLLKGEVPSDAVPLVVSQSKPKAASQPAKPKAQAASQPAKPKVNTMANWSVSKLQNAYNRAYDQGDENKMAAILKVLNEKQS